MKLIALNDDDEVIQKIATALRSVADAPLCSGQPVSLRLDLRHLKLWPEQTTPACLSRAPPSTPPPDNERVIEPYFGDPFPDYDTEPVMAYANDPDFAA